MRANVKQKARGGVERHRGNGGGEACAGGDLFGWPVSEVFLDGGGDVGDLHRLGEVVVHPGLDT